MTSILPKSKFWAKILDWMGWKPILVEDRPAQSVMAVAPHTSNWDFFVGLFYYLAYYGKPNFLIKKDWFVFPLNYFFKAIGGVSVNRRKGGGTVQAMADAFKHHPILHLAIAPEGSRRAVEKWKTGFLRIADLAKVPIEITKIDYKRKEVGILKIFNPTGDIEKDIEFIRSLFTKEMALYPALFDDLHK